MCKAIGAHQTADTTWRRIVAHATPLKKLGLAKCEKEKRDRASFVRHGALIQSGFPCKFTLFASPPHISENFAQFRVTRSEMNESWQ